MGTFPMNKKSAHDLRSIIFITVGFHIPDYLMTKQLGDSGCPKNEARHIT